MANEIQQINLALQRYYEYKGSGSDYDNTFTRYCKENSINGDVLVEEIKNETYEPGSCALDFEDLDDLFPYDLDKSDEDRAKQILSIIVQCYWNPYRWNNINLPKCR